MLGDFSTGTPDMTLVDTSAGTVTDASGNVYDAQTGVLIQAGTDPNAAAQEQAFWTGNTVSSSNSGPQGALAETSPAFQNVMSGADATPAQAAAAYVQGAAQAGVSVPASVAASWAAQGLNLSNISTAAGALFKLVQGPGGYVPTPVNATAHAAVAAGSAKANLVKYAIIGLVAVMAMRLL